jgi:F-type H+-transporting ATPase subunit alpha
VRERDVPALVVAGAAGEKGTVCMTDEQTGLLEKVRRTVEQTVFSPVLSEEGTVLSVGDEIVRVAGLSEARLFEIISFEGGSEGVVFDLDRDSIGIVLLAESSGIRAGSLAYKTDRIVSIDAGESLLGRVVDALGRPLDGGPPVGPTTPCPVEREAPPMVMRDFVSEPLYTGLKVIDAMFPIGRGQRELIIGDPSTGKTSIALDAIINQKHDDVICIYAAIGQKKSRVLKVIEELRTYGDLSRTICVMADASAALGLQYLAPFGATALAEYFLDRGRDVLIVYDDLTKHAEAYRSLSLLLRRPPGREAYPGDIFFIHARLLERSAKLGREAGGGSITALPIVETQQGRISSYIPTNLISITDGQIYLDTLLFNKGFRPAVNVGRSVSRIGGKAQTEAMKAVAERLKIDYSRFIEVEVFTKFGARVEEETARLIRRGERLREVLKQPRFRPCTLGEEVLSFLIVESGVLDGVELDRVDQSCRDLLLRTERTFPQLREKIDREGRIGRGDLERLREWIGKGGA